MSDQKSAGNNSKALKAQPAFLAYMSDFYYAIGILLFLVAAFFMFNEPVGASMLSFDMSLMLVVFAILYAASTLSKDQVLKYLAKYLVLIGFMVTCFQFLSDYGSSVGILQALFYISVVLFFVNFIFDVIAYIPYIAGIIWSFARGRSRR